MKEYNHNVVLTEESIANTDLRNKVFRNIQEEMNGDLVYEIQKNTCFNNGISLFSHDQREIQNNLMALRKY